MAGAHLLHDDYVHSRKDSDDEAFNLKIINRLVNTLSRELSLESYWKIRNTVNESMSTQEAEVENLKQQGNACVREKKYQKAMIHYSQAIKLDPKNYSLYSNRSFTFLMLEQYRDALNDALITIRLKPDWSKGYFRKGEVELKLSSYNEALESYNKALSLQPNEPKILEAMNKASKSLIKDRRADQQIPWLGAGVGIILGVTVVIADYVFTNKPTLTHPLLMALLTMTIAMIGFGIAKGLRYFLKHQRKSVLIGGDFPHCLLESNELNDIYVKESTDIKKKERINPSVTPSAPCVQPPLSRIALLFHRIPPGRAVCTGWWSLIGERRSPGARRGHRNTKRDPLDDWAHLSMRNRIGAVDEVGEVCRDEE
ncbi:HSOP3 protein, partial [Acromyrmex heyeri]